MIFNLVLTTPALKKTKQHNYRKTAQCMVASKRHGEWLHLCWRERYVDIKWWKKKCTECYHARKLEM